MDSENGYLREGNFLVLALIAKSQFPFVPSARRFFMADLDYALAPLL
jgi:hypothetical protein